MNIPYVHNWGVWYLDTHTYELVLIFEDTHEYGGREIYRIDLERCTTPGEVLDWVQHMAGKVWGKDPRVISHLVFALRDIVSLPANYCSCGSTLDGLDQEQIRNIVDEYKMWQRESPWEEVNGNLVHKSYQYLE